MNTLNVTISDPAMIRALAHDPRLQSAELFPGETNGHLFKPGDECELHGLENFPEFNGTRVRIASVREDGPKGRAYYVKGECDNYLNWVYEYRLKSLQPK